MRKLAGMLVLLWIAGESTHAGPYCGSCPGPFEPYGVVETQIRPKKAEVWVDEERAGQARDFDGRWDRLWIAPGEHVLEFRSAGYRPLRVFVDLEPAGYIQLVDELEPGSGLDPRSTERPAARPSRLREDGASQKRGLLRFDILPADSAVYLDGAFLGQADELARLHGALPVSEGTHRIEAVRPGYAAEWRDVEVHAGPASEVRIELRRAGVGD